MSRQIYIRIKMKIPPTCHLYLPQLMGLICDRHRCRRRLQDLEPHQSHLGQMTMEAHRSDHKSSDQR
jgi:hypothetical protein